MVQLLVGLLILFGLFFFIQIGWDKESGWAVRATIITIGIVIALIVLFFLGAILK